MNKEMKIALGMRYKLTAFVPMDEKGKQPQNRVKRMYRDYAIFDNDPDNIEQLIDEHIMIKALDEEMEKINE